MHYCYVGLAGVILSAGAIFFRRVAFRLVENTLSLLNVMLDAENSDEITQRRLITRLSRVVLSLLKSVAAVGIVLLISVLPVRAYCFITSAALAQQDYQSWQFYLWLSVGSIIPFVVFGRMSKGRNYPEASVLLHHIILDNYNISKSLFSIEKRFFSKKAQDEFVIVTGLARAGTTALTTLLHGSDKFHSLSYANMPFLTCPNLWKKLYNPKQGAMRERSHGDRVLFGYGSVEALEEYFWKIFLDDEFITDETLVQHGINVEVYGQYMAYQSLLRSTDRESMYLAKNNNFMLRYEGLRKLNRNFTVALLFRDPLEHAFSLFNQHAHYTRLQKEDEFVAEYMNWLGHHEFGLNHKPFEFGKKRVPSEYDESSIDYWLENWVDYYSIVLTKLDDPKLLLIAYEDFLSDPQRTIDVLEAALGLKFGLGAIDRFDNPKKCDRDAEHTIKEHAYEIHRELTSRKRISWGTRE